MKVNSSVLLKILLIVLSVSCFMMISCDNGNPCSNIKNGLDYKKGEPYDVIDKLEDFGNNYSTTQYKELLLKITELYAVYGKDGAKEKHKKVQEGNNGDYGNDDEKYNYPDDFIIKVRDIVEQNEKIYEETYKQIDKYTRKIPPMPWAFGCTIKGLVMYILHNPIIKCAVQYFDNYRCTEDETGETFERMVKSPNGPIDEWHNCLVTFIRLLKLTYEELESDNTDVKVHGRLWNQIQGLEYLLHFLCFGYRRGYFIVDNTVFFLKVFLNILGVFDFSVHGDVFSQGAKKLKYSAYFSYRTGLDKDVYGSGYVSEKYSDFICTKKTVCFSENISDIISKSNRVNWMITHQGGSHCFHFYLCKDAGSGIKNINGEHYKPVVEEKVYYIHDGWYEYKDFINTKLPKPGQIYHPYSIPFTYIILPKEVSVKQNRVININNVLKGYEFEIQFWDSLIPLLSTNIDYVKGYSKKLQDNFEYSNEDEKKILFRYFFEYLFLSISCIVDKYKEFRPDEKKGEFKFNDAINDLLSSEVDGGVLPKDEKNIDIVEIDNYYCSEKKKIYKLYPNKKHKGVMVENEGKVQPMLELLKETVNKMRWFLGNKDVVDLILSYKDVRRDYKRKEDFIEKNIGQIPEEINEMFAEYVKKYFSNIREDGKDFVFKKLVHGGNSANECYDVEGKYKQADVLKVNWGKTGLKDGDFPIFRKKFDKYEFFKSAQF